MDIQIDFNTPALYDDPAYDTDNLDTSSSSCSSSSSSSSTTPSSSGINVPARAPVQNVFAQRANANDEHHWRLLFEQTQKQANVIEGILAELKDLRSTVKKAAPVEEAAPAEEAAQVEEAAPAEEAAPLEQAAPVEAAPAEEAAPV
ncbi:hypothetical protein ACHWQZ_G004029 [Mnemiopsis leidyi]